MSVGFDFGLPQKPDRSIVSGSVPSQSDDSIISKTVADADIKPGNVQDIEWSNETSGNFGFVSYIRETRSVGKVCRDFIVSKHSYDGISQYSGEICRKRLTKSWSLQAFNEQT